MKALAGAAVLALLGAVLAGTAVVAAASAANAPEEAPFHERFQHRWMEMWGFPQGACNGRGPVGPLADGGHAHRHQVDADSNGIPNCLDDDWAPPMDGTGLQHRRG